MADSMQSLFLRAHVALHPEGAAMKELLAAGVSERRVINLYPYELREWLPALAIEAQERAGREETVSTGSTMYWRNVGVGDAELHARMRGIEESTRRLTNRKQNIFWAMELGDRCQVALSTPEGEAWLDAMDFVLTSQNAIQELAATISVIDELVAVASLWPEHPELHPFDSEWRPYIEASLAIMLPREFPIEHPPVRYDTMMFR